MRSIWLINAYGPIEGELWRDYRYNAFGKRLTALGWNVVWWTATFSHHFKRQRSRGWKDIRVCDGFTIRLVPTPSYRSNFGVGRLLKDWAFAWRVARRAEKESRPDVILAAENPMTLGWPSFRTARRFGIPLVIDQMDLWPEFFEKSVSRSVRLPMHLALLPVYAKRRRDYGTLSGTVALARNYLDAALQVNPVLRDRPHALVYNGIDVQGFRSKLARRSHASSRLPQKKDGEVWCIFAGTLGVSYDIPVVLQCAQLIADSEPPIRFIVVGEGPFRRQVEEAAARLPNLSYLGRLLPDDLIPVYGQCDIGLMAYSSRSNVDMPDKIYDYTAAGLALVNSLRGEASDHIEGSGAGVLYEAGDATSLAAAIMSLASDRTKMGSARAASADLAARFDLRVQVEGLASLLELIRTAKNDL